MLFLRIPFVRIGIMAALAGLFCLSVLMMINTVTETWQKSEGESALFVKSPNCVPFRDPTQVDQSLPPCQDFTAIVIAKIQDKPVYNYRHHEYQSEHRQLTLQFANGQSRTVGDLYADMWNSLHIGDTVAVKFWHGHVQTINANGYNTTVTEDAHWRKAGGAVRIWASAALFCVFGISLLRRLGSSR